MQLAEHRAYIERRERDHQKELDKLQMELEQQLRLHSDLIGKIITLDVEVMKMEMLLKKKTKSISRMSKIHNNLN
jgi:hypothetical protein